MYQSILRTTLSSQRNQVRQIKWLVSIWGEKSSLMGCKFFFAVKTFVKSKDILYLLATCWLLPSWCLFFWIMWMFNWSVILNVLVIMNYFWEWLTDENVISLWYAEVEEALCPGWNFSGGLNATNRIWTCLEPIFLLR